MTTPTTINSNEPSWLEFHGKFSSHVSRIRGETVGPVSLAGEEAAFAYFSRCAGNLKAKKANSNKEKTTPSCTDRLVRLPNVILENVTVEVYDYSAQEVGERGIYFATDNAAKKLTCVSMDTPSKFSGILGRLPAKNDFPECGVRLPESNVIYKHNEEQRTFQAENDLGEGGILKYDHLPVFPTSSTQSLPLLAHSLPKDRNSTFRVAFIISLLKRIQKLGHPRIATAPSLQLVQECADRLQGFLENTPGRSMAFGAVTNLQECFFVAVRAFEGSVNHNRSYWPYNSCLIIGKEKVARELARFCASDPLSMGLNPDLFHSPHLTVDSYWGRGSTGVTVQGRWQGDRIALKVSMNKNAPELERIILGYLETKGVEHVPRIHRAAQEDLYKRYNESCTAYSTVLIRIPEHTLKEEQILQVWAILKSLHAVGIVHRDVHSVHMMCNKTGNMYLKGFAAAQFYNTTLAGEHLDEALGRPLNELVSLYNQRNTNNLPTLPADDACAIIYATIQVNFPKSPVIHFPLYAEDYEFWAENRETWPDQWREELTPAMLHEVSIIQASLAELEKHRADLTYTVEQMDIAVEEAVKAVYRFKAAHKALKLPHSMWDDDDSNDEDGPQVPRRVWAPRRRPDRGTEPIPLVTESYYYDERLFGGLKKQRTTSR